MVLSLVLAAFSSFKFPCRNRNDCRHDELFLPMRSMVPPTGNPRNASSSLRRLATKIAPIGTDFGVMIRPEVFIRIPLIRPVDCGPFGTDGFPSKLLEHLFPVRLDLFFLFCSSAKFSLRPARDRDCFARSIIFGRPFLVICCSA